jgi:hypothetical protein
MALNSTCSCLDWDERRMKTYIAKVRKGDSICSCDVFWVPLTSFANLPFACFSMAH